MATIFGTGPSVPNSNSIFDNKAATEKSKVVNDKQPISSAPTAADDAGVVFGSFGLSYPVTGIETERADGTTAVNYSPECRVFICGGEVTKDVTNVSVSYTSDNMSNCSISLANPRGKYNITINDLVAGPSGPLWREDKSIQATYDYDWLKKQVPGFWGGIDRSDANKHEESKLTKVGNTLLGKSLTNTINSVVTGIKNMSRNRQKGFTQMLYEVKQQSNRYKAVGETVFDYADTVYVFFKGRFSTYWYFGFSGIVAMIDSNFAQGAAETINLQCHDIIGVLQRKKFTQQASILALGNLVSAQDLTQVEKTWNLYDQVTGDFSHVVKQIMYVAGKSYVDSVENSHFYYTQRCSLTKPAMKTTGSAIKSDNATSSTSTVQTGAQSVSTTINVAYDEPYNKQSEYFKQFQDTHAFDKIHHDKDRDHNNIGKQFREFLLQAMPGPVTTQEVQSIEIKDLDFYPGTAYYIDEGSKIIDTTLRAIAHTSDASTSKKATAILNGILDQMKKVAENDSTISWTVVGHIAFVTSCVGAMTVKPELQADFTRIFGRSSYGIIDLGPNLMNYVNGCSSGEGDKTQLDMSTGSTDPVYPYAVNGDGGGLTVSKERAHRVLRDLNILAASKGADYSAVQSIVSQMYSANAFEGVGHMKPREGTTSSDFIPFTTLEEAHDKLEKWFSFTTTSTVNQNNRYVELVPSKKSYTKKPLDAATGGDDSNSFVKDPHALRFSPLTSIYFQLNEIDINDFTPDNLKVFYDTSVRYWLKGPGTSLDSVNLGDTNKTGWKHTHGFGVCGIHPAMEYDFLDNFNTLPDVHAATMENVAALDGATLTPFDLLREQVYGIGTELSNSILAPTGLGIGTQHNYFRPRIFLVLPKKFRDGRERFEYSFAQFDLYKVQQMSTWECLQKLILEYEFTIYSSPMGDLFIEPLMHDFHPLDFYKKIEDRSICLRERDSVTGKWVYKGADVYFRTTVNTDERSIIGYRKDKAYIFNTKANHPFFITNKDLRRVTDTIKPENLISHVIMKGSVAGLTGIIGYELDKLNDTAVPFLDRTSAIVDETAKTNADKLVLTEKDNSASRFNANIGVYVANGFSVAQDLTLAVSATSAKAAELDEKKKVYTNKLEYSFMTYKQDATLGSVIDQASEAVKKLMNASFPIYNKELSALLQHYVDDPTYIPKEIDTAMIVNSNTAYGIEDVWLTTLYSLAPQIFQLYKYMYNVEIVGADNNYSTVSTESKPQILTTYNITTLTGTNGLLNLTISKLTYGRQFSTIDTTQSTDELAAALTNIMNDNAISSEEELAQLMTLHSASLLADTTTESRSFRDVNTSIAILQKQLTDIKGMDQEGYLTRGDLKRYEELQLYDPSKDFVTRYGWNPGPTIVNTYINNGAEAETYCKVLFDKINAKAFQLGCDIIGRPELGLNRPYYVEKTSAIGLCTDYSMNYSYGSSFNASVTLSYIRRNALAYAYTLGSLDRVVDITTASGELHNNAFFNAKALNYFKSIFATDKSTNRSKTLNDFVSKSTAGGPIGAVIGGGAQAFLKNKQDKENTQKLLSVNPDGLYVAHDCIGHTDYDKKNGLMFSELFLSRVTSVSTSDPKYIAQLGGHLITISQSQKIVMMNNDLNAAFLVLQTIEQDYEHNAIQIYQLTAQCAVLASAINDVNDELSQAVDSLALSNLHAELDKVEKQYTEAKIFLTAAENDKKTLDVLYTRTSKKIYGVAGSYTTRSNSSSTSVNYTPDSVYRSCKINLQIQNCLIYYLYSAIPEKDINGSSLRALCTIIDDTYVQSDATLTGKIAEIPLYITLPFFSAGSAETGVSTTS